MKTKTRVRIAEALHAAADALDPKKKVTAYRGGQVGQIYVANLRAYNEGKLVGEHITPDSDPDTLGEQIIEAIGGDPDDEWAIHDYENFPDLGEHPSIRDIATVARMQEDHDPEAVEAAIGLEPDVDDAADLLDEGYGVYDDEEAYAYEYVDGIGGVSQLGKDTITSYVDNRKLLRDLQHDVFFVRAGGNIYAFSRNV